MLYKSSKVFKRVKSISIYFTVKIIGDLHNKVDENFDWKIDIKGNKFHLTTSSNIEIWFNGKNQWMLYKKFEEVNITQSAGKKF